MGRHPEIFFGIILEAKKNKQTCENIIGMMLLFCCILIVVVQPYSKLSLAIFVLSLGAAF